MVAKRKPRPPQAKGPSLAHAARLVGMADVLASLKAAIAETLAGDDWPRPAWLAGAEAAVAKAEGRA